MTFSALAVGIPKEIKTGERRVGLTPNGVHALVQKQISVYVERNAGFLSKFSDEEYKRKGKSFVPAYLEMLSLGGSKKPEEIASSVGLDIQKPDFWDSGIGLLDKLVTLAEKLSQN